MSDNERGNSLGNQGNQGSQGSQGAATNIVNYFKFLSFIFPHALVSFFVILSLFNQNLKVIFYIFGLIVMNIIIDISQHSGYKFFNKNSNYHEVCTIFKTGVSLIDSPAYSVSSIAYTFAYLVFAMVYSGIFNISVIVGFFLALLFVIFTQIYYGCLQSVGAVMGLFVGIFMGIITGFITGFINRDYLYFSEYISDKVACSIPQKQTFRCNVYKNGEIINSF